MKRTNFDDIYTTMYRNYYSIKKIVFMYIMATFYTHLLLMYLNFQILILELGLFLYALQFLLLGYCC